MASDLSAMDPTIADQIEAIISKVHFNQSRIDIEFSRFQSMIWNPYHIPPAPGSLLASPAANSPAVTLVSPMATPTAVSPKRKRRATDSNSLTPRSRKIARVSSFSPSRFNSDSDMEVMDGDSNGDIEVSDTDYEADDESSS
ncbi:hypothetical protein FPQ18DRAFT_394175 [Pyronema domesticum]|nr:hypothetical protein FPQ18DRAFT_394175 [Pyronema domesticum]